MASLAVLLYIPNIIGYLRLILIIWAWTYTDVPEYFLILYSLNVVLDMIDGITARLLNQASNFGAVLDAVVDLFGRGVLWCHLGKYGYAVAAWEWFVFTCNHAQAGGKQWKYQFENAPLLVKKVMAHNFKTPLGALTMCGIFGLPMAIYCHQSLNVFSQIQTIKESVFWVLVTGRLLGLYVEGWCVFKHLYTLL